MTPENKENKEDDGMIVIKNYQHDTINEEPVVRALNLQSYDKVTNTDD